MIQNLYVAIPMSQPPTVTTLIELMGICRLCSEVCGPSFAGCGFLFRGFLVHGLWTPRSQIAHLGFLVREFLIRDSSFVSSSFGSSWVVDSSFADSSFGIARS